MKNPLRQLEADIRQLIDRALRDGWAPDVLKRNLHQLLRDRGFVDGGATLQQAFIDNAMLQFGWIADRTLDTTAREATLTILNTTGQQFATIGGNVEQSIVDVFSRGIREKLSSREITDLLERGLSKPRAIAQTIANTGLQGFGRVESFRQGKKIGAQELRYSGPPGEREFCLRMMALSNAGKTYTVEQVQNMSNGQGLPVLIYCGGYNCRHFWQWVLMELEEAIERVRRK